MQIIAVIAIILLKCCGGGESMSVFENFISYRRSETTAEVQALYFELQKRGYLTFCDVHSLSAGRIDQELLSTIHNCTNFILVLGPHSLDRCINEDDWLRIEIREAINAHKNIICVFVGEIAYPCNLPDDIAEIRLLNSIKFEFIYFASFVDRLIDRFLVSEEYISYTIPSRDFIIDEGKLIKYVGTAPIVIIPDHVRIIGQNAFKDKTYITSVTLSKNTVEIQDNAFERCNKLQNIHFPNSVKIIGRRAFYRCYALAYISFNDELEMIEEEAFAFCSKIKLIQLGSKIQKIAFSAFNGCVQLVRFSVDEKNEYYKDIEGILYTRDSKTLIRCGQNYSNDVVKLPDSVENISPWAFSQCLSIVDISLPQKLKTVEKFAFADCIQIRKLTLGNNIESFDISAINGWSSHQCILTGKKFNPSINYQIQKKLQERTTPKKADTDDVYLLIKATFESEDEALNMAKMLSFNKLIGCAQIYPLNTFYMWDDQFCNEREYEMSCITRKSLYLSVESFINNHHSYNLCQIIAVPIIYSSNGFGDWINSLTDICED